MHLYVEHAAILTDITSFALKGFSCLCHFNKLLEDLRGAKYIYVFISVFIGLIAYISRGVRWLIILEPMGYKPKLSNSIYSIIIGYFANLAIPRIGEITRCTTMNQAEDIPVDKLFGTVILERIIDLIMLLSITLLTILLKVEYPDVVTAIITLGIVGVIGVVILYLLRSRINNFPLAVKIRTFFLGIKEGLVSVRKIKNRRGFYFHTLLIWFCYYTMTWVVFYSLKETSHLNMIDGLFILVVGGFGMAAPVQGGIGAYHFIVSLGLGVLGIDKVPALSFATIVHTSQTLFILFAGALALGLIYINNRNKKRASELT